MERTDRIEDAQGRLMGYDVLTCDVLTIFLSWYSSQVCGVRRVFLRQNRPVVPAPVATATAGSSLEGAVVVGSTTAEGSEGSTFADLTAMAAPPPGWSDAYNLPMLCAVGASTAVFLLPEDGTSAGVGETSSGSGVDTKGIAGMDEGKNLVVNQKLREMDEDDRPG
jgi:hypothetical protein